MNRAERRHPVGDTRARRANGISQANPAAFLAEIDRAARNRLDRGETPAEVAAALAELVARTSESMIAQYGPTGYRWLVAQLAERRRRLLEGGDPE